MADRMAGRVLNGRYELLSVLGGGGMALVYRARDRVLNRIVAIKVLREQYASDPQFLQRFTREAQAAGALSHPNIASVYDVGQDGDLPFIVMELVPGISLRDVIARDAPLPADQAVEYAAQILSALDYAHRNGLIHRDIKPGNVLIMPQGTVKVVDFGIAKSATDLSLTGAGMALGTAAYFSPEQARGEGARPQSDIYSLGVTLYEMLTGRTPFAADNDVAMAYKHISEAPVPPRQWNPAIPPLLERIVLRALAKNPTTRFQSAAEMEQALRNYAAFGAQATAAVPLVAPPPSVVAVPRPTVAAVPPRRPPPLPPVPAYVQSYRRGPSPIIWVLGLVAVLLLLSGAVLALTGGAFSATATPTAVLGVAPTFVPETLPPAERPTPPAPPTAPPAVATAVPPTAPPTAPPLATTAVPTNSPRPTAAPSNTAVPQIHLPDLTSRTQQEAQAIASALGLKLAVTGQQSDPNHPAGTIITQNPPSGTPVLVGSTVGVVVSTGPPLVAMPSVLNTEGNQAKVYLTSAAFHFQVTVQQEPSGSVPAGVVARQDPDPGTSVHVGDTVTIWISTGPPPPPNPPPPVPATPVPATPVPATPVPPEPTATTAGPPLAIVPDVVGMDQKEAVTIVSAARLAPQVQKVGHGNGGSKAGQVTNIQPSAGTEVLQGSTVILDVLSGK